MNRKPRVHASKLSFSYTDPLTADILSGEFDGTLLSNGNVFEVTSVNSLLVNGAAVPLPSYLGSTDKTFGFGNTPAAVSLDGSYMALFAADGSDSFAFAVGDLASSNFLGGNMAGASTRYGGTDAFADYSQANWSASLVAPTSIPEPGSLVLLGTGILGLAGAARRKLFRA
jgi:hypothetical protein